MAFTVTPTSGAAPYTFTANVEGSDLIDGVNYSATVLSTRATGSCPVEGIGNPWTPNLMASLLNSESIVSDYGTVASGDCRTTTLLIKRLHDNEVVASANTVIDNL